MAHEKEFFSILVIFMPRGGATAYGIYSSRAVCHYAEGGATDYAEGGATEAYCSRAVCPLRISRHSLKTKR